MGLKPVKFTHKVRYSFFAFKIFGLSPFADDASPWKTILIAHSLVLLAITLFLLYSAFILTDIFSQSLAGTLASIVGELMFCGLIATNVIILLQALIFRSEGQQIESRFDTIHHLLREKLFVDISAARIQRKLFWKNFSIVVFLVLVIAFNLLALSFYDEPLGYNLHSLWPIVIIRTRCIHNIFLIDLITEHLNGLNGKLEATIAMAEREKESEDSFKIMYAQRDFGHLARTPYSELMTLKDVYGYIWDITNLINDTFGWSLLAVSTQNFLEFTCNGYWLFLATDNKLSGLTAINALCTIIPVVFVLGNIAYSCYLAIDSGSTTGSLIHRLEKETKADELHNALVREFSMQVAHEPIRISANGFFNLDFSLLGSMAAATVTYLVILIQFQQSEKNKSSTT